MRNRVLSAVLLVTTAACFSGTRTIVIHAPPRSAPPPQPAPPPRPAPDPVEPMEVVVGRPLGRHVYVQTNRPAYVALFEISPDGIVEIVHPASAQQQVITSGPNRLPLWWNPSDAAPGRVSRAGVDVRYIYALASERPLRLTSSAFVPGNLLAIAGLDARTAQNPYLVMRALSRRFVPPSREEQWAEDAYRLATRTTAVERVARVYCADGTVIEIPEEIADRAWCPEPGRRNAGVAYGKATRPDSIKGNNGRHLAIRARGEPGRAPGRVSEEQVIDRGPGNNGRGNAVGITNGNGNANGRGSSNGNAVGQTGNVGSVTGRGNANNDPDSAIAKGGRGNGNANGRGNAVGIVNGNGNANGRGNSNGNAVGQAGNAGNGNAAGQTGNGGNAGNGRGNARGNVSVDPDSSAVNTGRGNGNGRGNVRAADPKPIEAKPVEAKPDTSRAVGRVPETVQPDRPTETKPEKPAEVKPEKPVEVKPEKPAEVKPDSVKTDKPGNDKPGNAGNGKPEKQEDPKGKPTSPDTTKKGKSEVQPDSGKGPPADQSRKPDPRRTRVPPPTV